MKVEVKTYLCADYREIENFIKEKTGFSLELGVLDDYYAQNGYTYFASVNKDEKIWEKDLENIIEFIKTGKYKKFSFSLNDLLCYMCKQGMLAPGEYQIDFSW